MYLDIFDKPILNYYKKKLTKEENKQLLSGLFTLPKMLYLVDMF